VRAAFVGGFAVAIHGGEAQLAALARRRAAEAAAGEGCEACGGRLG
jgi:hypothetical protein